MRIPAFLCPHTGAEEVQRVKKTSKTRMVAGSSFFHHLSSAFSTQRTPWLQKSLLRAHFVFWQRLSSASSLFPVAHLSNKHLHTHTRIHTCRRPSEHISPSLHHAFSLSVKNSWTQFSLQRGEYIVNMINAGHKHIASLFADLESGLSSSAFRITLFLDE